MPRTARVQSESGIYHIMVRGVNKHNIFLAEQDRIRYLQTLDRIRQKIDFDILGYCLMDNHVHLLLREGSPGSGSSVSRIMHRVGTSYVRWFNSTYERVGHLFQGRFLSVPVEHDPQVLAVLRYIHQNPVEAKIVSTCLEYPWSSHRVYERGIDHIPSLTDTSLAIEIAGGLPQLIDYLNTRSDDTANPASYNLLLIHHGISEKDLCALLRSLLNNQPTGTLKHMPKQKRDEILSTLKSIPGISLSQIVQVTGFSRSTVFRARPPGDDEVDLDNMKHRGR